MNNTKITTKEKIMEEFEKICYWEREPNNDPWGMAETRGLNAEHLGDVTGKLLPAIRTLISQALDQVAEETRRQTLEDVMILIERYAKENFENVSNTNEVLEPAKR